MTEPIILSAGRQLFVDDYLIENTDLKRVWHAATSAAENPVLSPETEIELNQGRAPFTAVFKDGCWYDPVDKNYKLYYNAGWTAGTSLAVSNDGIHWTRPDFGIVPGTNIVIPANIEQPRDGALCWLDQNADEPGERWKMFIFYRYLKTKTEGGTLYTSADGIHWTERTKTGPLGDNSSFFFDPFRKDWCFSVRTIADLPIGRSRGIIRRKSFIDAPWKELPPVTIYCDENDHWEHPEPSIGTRPQLYDFNAAPYESLMIGAASIFWGPENNICFEQGRPKTIHLQYAFSRDGEHWNRPETREMYLRCTEKVGDWNRGYLHPAGGMLLVFHDHLRFYYSGFSSKSTLKPGEEGPLWGETAMYASSSIGYATLRRDGFASMNTEKCGTLTTKLLKNEHRTLWINAKAENLQVGLMDAAGKWLPGYTPEECLPFSGDSVKTRIIWKNKTGLPSGQPFKIQFKLSKGELYSFWFSPSDNGESLGYVSAGSQDYCGDRDIIA